jgi:hypothetical protein
MIGELLTVAKAAVAVLSKPIKAGAQRARVWLFRVRTRECPLPEGKAKQIAHSVLAGDVLRGISFRNIDSPHVFVASLRRSSEKDFDLKVYVLEQIGESFRVVWKSDRLCSSIPTDIEVRDVDGDGNSEVIFEDQSYGTGGGSKSLFVYSIESSRLFSVTESLNWQERAGPISPEIEIKTGGAPEMARVLEEVATKHGFLKPGRVVDFDAPEFAVQRWHKENGTRTAGTISRHYYPGYPLYKATVVTTLDCGPVVWISTSRALWSHTKNGTTGISSRTRPRGPTIGRSVSCLMGRRFGSVAIVRMA